MSKCPYCQEEHPETALFCPKTGREFLQQPEHPRSNNCTACGALLPAGARVCPACGKEREEYDQEEPPIFTRKQWLTGFVILLVLACLPVTVWLVKKPGTNSNNLPLVTNTYMDPTEKVNATVQIASTPTSIIQFPTPSIAVIPSPGFSPTPGSGVSNISKIDGMLQFYVPAGEFMMGSNSSNFPDERPEHKILLDAFWIDHTEVTNAMFAAFVTESGYVGELEEQGVGWLFTGNGWEDYSGKGWRNPLGPNTTVTGRDGYPVVQVTWNDAAAYCNWAGRRLPTEAEWEKAARGPDGNIYPWGSSDPNDQYANYGNNVGDLSNVNRYEKLNISFYGAMDMAGNVYEWVADWYGETYYQSSPSSNPIGPENGKYKVIRGGSWQLESFRLSGFEREVSQPGYGNSNIGIRCAQDPTP